MDRFGIVTMGYDKLHKVVTSIQQTTQPLEESAFFSFPVSKKTPNAALSHLARMTTHFAFDGNLIMPM